MLVFTTPLHLVGFEDLSSHAIEGVMSTALASSGSGPAAQELTLRAAPLCLRSGYKLPLDALIRPPTMLHFVVL